MKTGKTMSKLLRIALAALLVIGTVIGAGCSSKPKAADSDYAIIPQMFWGRKVVSGTVITDGQADYSKASQYGKYQVINIDGQDTEMSQFPMDMEVNPYSGRMRLLFIDRFQATYCFEGTFEIVYNVLTFHPEAIVDGMEAEWAKTAEQRNAITPDAISFDTAIRYTSFRLLIDSNSVTMKNYVDVSTGNHAMQGTLSSDSEPYENIKEMNLVKNGEEEGICRILFMDGSCPTDGKISSLYEDSIGFSWDHIEKDYNGRREEFKESEYYSIKYIDTRPYGFIVLDTKEGKVYRYQDPLETLDN